MEALIVKLKKMREEGLIRSRQKALERQERLRQKMKLRVAERKRKLAALNEAISRILNREETKKMLGNRNLQIVLKPCDGQNRFTRKSFMKKSSKVENLLIKNCFLTSKIILEKCDSPRRKSESLKAEPNSPISSQSVKILLERCDSPVKNGSPNFSKVNSKGNETQSDIGENCENEFDSCRYSSSCSECSFDEKTNHEFFNSVQSKHKISSDFNDVKLMNVSVVLDDLFSKSPSDLSALKEHNNKLMSEKQINGVARTGKISKRTDLKQKERHDKLFSSISGHGNYNSKRLSSKRQPFKPLEALYARKVMPSRQRASKF